MGHYTIGDRKNREVKSFASGERSAASGSIYGFRPRQPIAQTKTEQVYEIYEQEKRREPAKGKKRLNADEQAGETVKTNEQLGAAAVRHAQWLMQLLGDGAPVILVENEEQLREQMREIMREERTGRAETFPALQNIPGRRGEPTGWEWICRCCGHENRGTDSCYFCENCGAHR